MKVILISGKAGNGKDSFAAALREFLIEHGEKVLILHFADLVKYYATQYCGWDGNKGTEGRALLQKIGNNTFRQFDPDYWARITAECAHVMGEYFGITYVLIPDNRYPNEIDIVKEYNDDVITVRIERYDDDGKPWINPNMTEEQLSNEGEVALDHYAFDYIIENHGLGDIQDSAEVLLDDLTSR